MRGKGFGAKSSEINMRMGMRWAESKCDLYVKGGTTTFWDKGQER